MCAVCTYFLLVYLSTWYYLFFFFQAEDGIRDTSVTGVQTCALPISAAASSSWFSAASTRPNWACATAFDGSPAINCFNRSEERRVGKECRSRWSPDHEKKNRKRRRE